MMSLVAVVVEAKKRKNKNEKNDDEEPKSVRKPTKSMSRSLTIL